MSESNYDILMSKFGNFKKFIREVAKSPKVGLFDSYSDAQFLQYSALLLHLHNEGKLREIVDKTISELLIDPVHSDKVNAYYLCFCDYLGLMMKAKDKMIPEVREPTEEELKEIEDKINKLNIKKDN